MMSREKILRSASAVITALPPVRGLGLIIEYATRVFSRWDVDVATRVHGSLMWANPSTDPGRWRLFTQRYHDRAEIALVRRVVRPGDYVVDVGANFGIYSLLAARLGAAVTAIEAEPSNVSVFRRNIALNGYQIDVKPVGVSDKVEELRLSLHDSNLGAHSFVVPVSSVQSVEIACFPLAVVIEKRRPRLMKMDIEGFEYRVLKRYFKDIDEALRPEWILIEEWDNPPGGSAVALCQEQGYRVAGRWGINYALTTQVADGSNSS